MSNYACAHCQLLSQFTILMHNSSVVLSTDIKVRISFNLATFCMAICMFVRQIQQFNFELFMLHFIIWLFGFRQTQKNTSGKCRQTNICHRELLFSLSMLESWIICCRPAWNKAGSWMAKVAVALVSLRIALTQAEGSFARADSLRISGSCSGYH